MAKQLSVEGREQLKRDMTRGISYALAPIVRAVSTCPIKEFADDPFGTIREVLKDLEDLKRTPDTESYISTGVLEENDNG